MFIGSLKMSVLSQLYHFWGFPGGTSGKESTCQRRRRKRVGFDPCVRKIPWWRKWCLTPEFLPGKFHGQRSFGRLPFMGPQRIGHDWACTHTTMPLPVELFWGWVKQNSAVNKNISKGLPFSSPLGKNVPILSSVQRGSCYYKCPSTRKWIKKM